MTLAQAERDIGALCASAGGAREAREELDLRDSLLEEDERRRRRAARRHRRRAEALLRRRDELPPLKRGLIPSEWELLATVSFGTADIAALTLFLSAEAELTGAQPVVVAALAGLAAAIVGIAGGRAAYARVKDDAHARWALLVILGLVGASIAWFLFEMLQSRDAPREPGVAATLTFGVPLIALAMTGAATISFVRGAGTAGDELREQAKELFARGAAEAAAADAVLRQRHDLRAKLAAQMGAHAAAEARLDSVRTAAVAAAEAHRVEGLALGAVIEAFAKLFPPVDGETAEEAAPDTRGWHVVAAAAAGAAAGGTGAVLTAAPDPILALSGAVGATLTGASWWWVTRPDDSSATDPAQPSDWSA